MIAERVDAVDAHGLGLSIEYGVCTAVSRPCMFLQGPNTASLTRCQNLTLPSVCRRFRKTIRPCRTRIVFLVSESTHITSTAVVISIVCAAHRMRFEQPREP